MKTILLAALLAAPVATEDLDRLDTRIATFAGDAQPMPVDRRLQLAACPSPATIEWQDSQSIAVRCALLGWRLRVPLAAVQSVRQDTRPAIRRGDAVEARYEADDFDISAMMIAMEDGRTGDSIRVKNPDTGRASVATVSGQGFVLLSH
jgi:flagellar basal body P-ring formation protein FlgA